LSKFENSKIKTLLQNFPGEVDIRSDTRDRRLGALYLSNFLRHALPIFLLRFQSGTAFHAPVTHEKKTKAATDFTNFCFSGMESSMKSA